MTIKHKILLDAFQKRKFFPFPPEDENIEEWYWAGEYVGEHIVEYLRQGRGSDEDEREAKVCELGNLVHSYDHDDRAWGELIVFLEREIPELPTLLPDEGFVGEYLFEQEDYIDHFLVGFLSTVPWINERNRENEDFFSGSEGGEACWKSEFETVSLP